MPFAPQLYRLGLRVLPLLRVSLTAPSPVPAPLSARWVSWAPPEACCCGAAGIVSGPFERSSRDIASEICRLWVPAAGVVGAAVEAGLGSSLAKNSFTDTRSSSSSAWVGRYHLVGVILRPKHIWRSSWGRFFHLGIPQEGHRIGWNGKGFRLPLGCTVANVRGGIVL